MSRAANACACHTNLGIAPVAVSDEALEKIMDVSIPTPRRAAAQSRE
jgi:hypothetical protein